MKYLSFIIIFCASFTSLQAGFFDDFISGSQPNVIYCNGGECGLDEGVALVKGWINDLETERTLSQYIQDVVQYLLMFLSIIAVLYIIYAGFMILTGNGDEEKLKKSRTTIVYVALWLVIIWLAWPITLFILNILNIT